MDLMINNQNVTKGAQVVARVLRKNSITRMGKDSMFQFPFMISDGIPADEKHTIAKSSERNYASLLVSIFSLYGDVDLRKHKNIAKFLKGFHDNNSNLYEILESATDVQVGLDSSNRLTFKYLIDEVQATETLVPAMWDDVSEQIVTESINDIYKPYDSVYNRLETALNDMKVAQESNAIYNEDDVPRDKEGKPIHKYRVAVDRDSDGNVIMYDAKGRVSKNGRGKPRMIDPSRPKVKVAGMADKQFPTATQPKYELADANPKGKALMVDASMKRAKKLQVGRSEKTDALAPTIIEVTFVVHDGQTKWMQDLVLGIKAMIRNIPSQLMIANMVEATHQQPIFTFLKWTNGEQKIRDLIFNITGAKSDALSISKEDKWLTALRKRAKNRSLYQALLKRNVNPNATIIITEQEAMEVKTQTGIDLSDPKNVRPIMDKYFLLGFGIYSTEDKILDMFYDGDIDFASYSLRALVAENKKDSEILAMNKY